MRFQLGISFCLLAGCVVQPTSSPPSAKGATSATVTIGAVPLSLVPRIGIEHLPPDVDLPGDSALRVEPQTAAPLRSTQKKRAETAALGHEPLANRHTWSMSADDLAAIDDPVARETLQFVRDLVEADQRRVRQEVGTPFLTLADPDLERGPLLHSEEDLLTAQQEWAQQHGPALLRRPLQQFLRRLPVVQHVEFEVEDFRSDHVPLSEPYQLVHGRRGSLGRLSLRLHASDPGDPVEIAYVQRGIRLGTSQEVGKVSIDWALSDTVRFEVRTRTNYATSEYGWRGDLSYRPSLNTSLHVAIGDDMDFLSTSSIYSLFETPMDGSPGLVLYAVHIF